MTCDIEEQMASRVQPLPSSKDDDLNLSPVPSPRSNRNGGGLGLISETRPTTPLLAGSAKSQQAGREQTRYDFKDASRNRSIQAKNPQQLSGARDALEAHVLPVVTTVGAGLVEFLRRTAEKTLYGIPNS